MPDIAKHFVSGRMNKDDDERLLQNGEYRHAENILVINSEGSDAGAVENIESSRRLTKFAENNNPKTITPNLCVDNVNKLVYWMVKNDAGCFLYEYDDNHNITSVVLADTRPVNERVFNLSEDYLITGIEKLITGEKDKDLLIWTDGNMEPCCINIERAKTFGENNFEKEDILLIKKPPKEAPVITPISTTEQNNYIEEKFFSFAYRFKYLDGEYSALSSFTHYSFIPNRFRVDFVQGFNAGMKNRFNAVNIQFNTGDKRVTHIEIIAKPSNSNALYRIESFEKSKEFWGNNQTRSINFSNNKIYTLLPTRELFRNFDNVPLSAKAMALIGNRIAFGNYVEGRDLVDKFDNPIRISLSAGFNTYNAEGEELYSFVMSNRRRFIFYNQSNETGGQVVLQQGSVLVFKIELEPIIYSGIFESEFTFILQQDYATFNQLATDPIFINFVEEVMTSTFANGYTPTNLPDGTVINGLGQGFSILSSNNTSITIQAPTISLTLPGPTPFTLIMNFRDSSNVVYANSATSTSLKSLYDYEVGIIYLDEFNRATTPLVSPGNTFFVPIENAITQNKATLRIFHLPPKWAERYKVAIKAQPLTYQIVYANQFFVDGIYRWVKLEGENKDKVKEGDVLILKQDREGAVTSLTETKVLEVAVQQEDFITDNVDSSDNEIKEPAGVYMKIHPTNFTMDYRQDEFLEEENSSWTTSGRPVSYCELFSVEDESNPGEFLDKELVAGNVVTLFFRSRRRNRPEIVYEKQFIIQQNYDNFKEWFDAELNNVVFTGNNNEVFDAVDVLRGERTRLGSPSEIRLWSLTPSATGRRYLRVRGVYGGNGVTRRGFLDVKVSLRTTEGVFVFETKPKRSEQEIFYESEETFYIENGLHLGNVENQDDGGDAQDAVVYPAVVETNFFNCYTFGNGVESYQVEDSIIKDSLNIDLRPSATLTEEYKQIHRFADITWSDIHNEGFNGLNDFNLSTGNFKELEKNFASIQKLFNRNDNLLVLQELKAGYVLYNKNTISTALGEEAIVKSTEIFGEYVSYLGQNGIGKRPESFSADQFRVYYMNPNRGTPIRLSMDGTEEINNKMVSWFREEIIQNPNTKILGAYDPHLRMFWLSFQNIGGPVFIPKLDVPYIFNDVSDEIVYSVPVQSVVDEAYIDYEVSEGEITIEVTFDGNTDTYQDLSGSGTITISTGKTGTIDVEITPKTTASFTVTNRKGQGQELKVVTITLGEEKLFNQSVINRYRWGRSANYEENILFSGEKIQLFNIETGIEGEGRFPLSGSSVTVESYKGSSQSLDFEQEFFIGYLITDVEYGKNEEDVEEILGLATFVPLTTIQLTKNEFIKTGNFLFTRDNEILYLIWDYRIQENDEPGSESISSS